MKTVFSLTIFVLLIYSNSYAGWEPQVLNGIKWTAPNQDVLTLQYAKTVGILRVPIKYYGGVDTNADGKIDAHDIENFQSWVEQHIPQDYTGPVVMDYEKPWWEELRGETITHSRLQELTKPYAEGLKIANSIRPLTQWGYFGIPTRRNTTQKWLDQGLSLEPIIKQSDALFPAIYDCSRGKDRTSAVERQIAQSLESANGLIPVYAFMTHRYCGEGGDRSLFVPDEIFLRQANAALQASWTDHLGIQHRIKGIILWDAFGYTPQEEWGSLDETHQHYFELLVAITNAWKESMDGVEIVVEPTSLVTSNQGMQEPTNSGEVLDTQSNNQQKSDRQEDDRIPSGRVEGGRVPR